MILREKFKWRPHENESTDAQHKGGVICSSDEVFVMYTFRARKVKARGKYFTGFNPAISNKAAKMIRQKIRSWKFHRWSDKSLQDLAIICRPMLRGWINYYGRFYKSRLYEVLRHLDNILKRWATKKYRKLKGSTVKASEWLRKIAQSNPKLFSHWRGVIGQHS